MRLDHWPALSPERGSGFPVPVLGCSWSSASSLPAFLKAAGSDYFQFIEQRGAGRWLALWAAFLDARSMDAPSRRSSVQDCHWRAFFQDARSMRWINDGLSVQQIRLIETLSGRDSPVFKLFRTCGSGGISVSSCRKIKFQPLPRHRRRDGERSYPEAGIR